MIRKLISENKYILNEEKLIVNVSKGIEVDSLMTMSEVIDDVYGEKYARTVVLSGPSHAEEVVRNFPTTLVASSTNKNAAKSIQTLFQMNIYELI